VIRKFHYLNVVKTLSDKSDEKKLGGLQAGYLVSFDKKKEYKNYKSNISITFITLSASDVETEVQRCQCTSATVHTYYSFLLVL